MLLDVPDDELKAFHGVMRGLGHEVDWQAYDRFKARIFEHVERHYAALFREPAADSEVQIDG